MEPVITTEKLSKHFGHTTALDQLTLEVDRGEVFGFLGPNGAGKTTTVRLLLGLLKPSSGDARVLGLDAWGDPTRLHARVGYVPGEFAIWPQLTGGEMLELLGCSTGPSTWATGTSCASGSTSTRRGGGARTRRVTVRRSP